MHYTSIDMKKLKEIRNSLQNIHSFLTNTITRGVSGCKIRLNDSSIAYIFREITKIENIIAELEKLDNYNNASATAKKPHKEMVSHPDHYQGNKIECIEAMLDVFGKEKVSAFCELNAFKYQWRADKKGTDIQDKRKAIWYLDKYVELNKEES